MLRLSRTLNLTSVSKLAFRNSRAFGGHAHGDSHGHGDHHVEHHDEGAYQPVYHPPAPKPYEVPHEHVDRTKAFMFGEDPAHPKPAEGWEVITYVTYVLTLAILGYSLYTKGESPMNDWARLEALARERAMAHGETIEYGRYYSEEEKYLGTEFVSENVGVAPENAQK